MIGPQPANIHGLAWDNATNTLWAVADVPRIGTLNTSTAAFTAAATITGLGAGEVVSGITFIDAASTFHLLTATSTASCLYTLNTGTGAATLIGAMGVGNMVDIAINADGEMYGHSILTDSIYSIDTATGAATLIGPTGFAANFAQGMSFDKSTGVLYAWIHQGGGANTFAAINLATGAATTVASPASGEYEGAITSAASDDTIFEHGFESVP